MKTKLKTTIGIGIGLVLIAVAVFIGGGNLFKGSFNLNFRPALTHSVSPSYLIPARSSVVIRYTANRALNYGLYLYIEDSLKKNVKELLSVRNPLPKGTSNSIAWDGRDNAGNFVPPGSYNYIFLGTTTLGTGKINVKQFSIK
ncbi:hypothetical protein HZA42_03645 [Candidatus Peregrinibacteria bacterium]|nr:hypothetical protein [Candidatus Peregrinibacteria bacterium]